MTTMTAVLNIWMTICFLTFATIRCEEIIGSDTTPDASDQTVLDNNEGPQNESLKALKDADPDEVYTYTGSRNYNDPCISDASKEDLLVRSAQNSLNNNMSALLEKFKNESCNITKFLECRQVGLKINKTRTRLDPILKCSCPDYEKIDTVHPSGYFDNNLDQCVLKVRTKCTELIIPPSARRYNGTGSKLNKARDNRTQPTSMPCVSNGICNIATTNESSDVNVNKCICQTGYYPTDDNECHKIGKYDTSSGAISGLFLAVTAFAVFFTAMLCHREGVWDGQRHGSQEELIIPGSRFRKKIFPNIKRRA